MARMIQETTTQYKPLPHAHFFHSLPHLNVSLHLVNNTFAPESELYIESLGILGSIPAAWLILTLFLLLLYFMTRCCDRKPRPKHSIAVLKWTLTIFLCICLCITSGHFYGNDDVHNGMLISLTAARILDDKINAVKNQTKLINDALNVTIEHVSGQLREVLDTPVQNQTALSELFSAFRLFSSKRDDALKNLNDITRPLKYVNLTHLINIAAKGEIIRWLGTTIILFVLIAFCMVLVCAVSRRSRKCLILYSVLGLFNIIISWTFCSIYLPLAVAVSDFCVNPNSYVEYKARNSFQSDILLYYITCENSLSNPFTQSLMHGSSFIEDMNNQLTNISRISKDLFGDIVLPHLDMLTKEVYHTSVMMSGLTTELECSFYHTKYVEIIKSPCRQSLHGLTMMLVTSILMGLFFTILVWVDSHLWIYFHKKQEYTHVDEQDPFLPPSAASQAITVRTLRTQGRDVNLNGGSGMGGTLRPAGIHPIGTISHQRLGIDSGQYATLNRKFRTLEHPARAGRQMVSFDSASHTLGHGHKKQALRGDGPGQYSTLSKKCKTLESNDFY